jgi:RHS repeat-associated protein/uncharacterized repeat protein (TIGR01451 family)
MKRKVLAGFIWLKQSSWPMTRKLLALVLIEVMAITSLPVAAAGAGLPAGSGFARVLGAQAVAALLEHGPDGPASAYDKLDSRPAVSVRHASLTRAKIAAAKAQPPVRPLLQSGTPGNSGIAVSVGFADNSSASPNFPVPWQGPSAILFLGGGTNVRAGTVRLDNISGTDLTIDKVTVDLGRPGPVFQLWSNFTVPANGSAILTQTSDNNFNTSGSSPLVGCGQPLVSGETRIPKITVTVAGTDSVFSDSAHVLDTGGFDSSCRGNQSLAWRPVGTTGPERAGATLHLSSENAPHDTGTATTFTASFTDAADQPLAHASVALNVLNGPNAGKSASGPTDSNGAANIQYTGSAQGVDLAQATVANASTGTIISEQASTTWTSAQACTAPATQSNTSKLVYAGQTSGSFGDQLRVAALLTDGSGQPLAGRTLAITVGGGNPFSATTDSNGVGAVQVTPGIGQTAVSISFAGDNSLPAAQVSSTLTIQPKATLLRYTGNSLLGSTGTQTVTAALSDALGIKPIANRTTTFAVGPTQATAVTDANGNASATITFPANQAVGPAQLSISFAGDADYKASSRVVPVEIYLTTSFVIWGGNSGGLKVGTDVNFWGAQWSRQVTSGNFAGDSSFKGFAGPVNPIQQCQPNVTSSTLAQGCWPASPGNSGVPPASLPAYIEVIVSTAIARQGSSTFGNIACGAILKVDASPAYGPDPSHPGFGVITAVNGDCAGVFPKPAVLTATQTQLTPVLPQQQVAINASISNSGATDATNVALSESFDGLIPASATQSLNTIAAGQSTTATFQASVPAIPGRQSAETSTDYETRLAGIDGRLFTASGELTFSDIFAQLYQPVDFSSFSTLQIPRLSAGLTGPSCIVPGSKVIYPLTIGNIGSGTAAQGTAAVTLPDGTTTSISVPQILSSASFAGAIPWQAPVIKSKDPAENTAAYLARLAAADNVTVAPVTASVTWQDALNNNYGAIDQQFSSVKQRLPILSLSPVAPATILPNQAATVTLTVANSGGGNAVQSSIAIKRQGTADIAVPVFSVPAGQTVAPSAGLRLPAIPTEGAQETDAQYLSRLQAADNQKLSLDANLSWTDSSGNVYGPTSNPFTTTGILPILTVAATGAATAKPGDNISYTLTLQNVGHADASAINIAFTLPDGSVQHPFAGSGLVAGGTAQTAVTFVVPTAQTAGPATAKLRLGWSDAAGNVYGFESATVTTLIVAQTVAISDFTPKQGPAGSAVSILGTNLSVTGGPTTVLFAGPNNTQLSAKINFAGATQLAVVAPDGAVTGSIQVTNSTGTATSAVPFTVGARQDFSVTLSPPVARVPQGSVTSFVVSVTSPQTTFTQLATLSVAGMPQGVAAGFTPGQITAGASSTLALDLGATTLQPGTYSFTVHALASIDGKQQDRTANASFTVIPAGQTTLAGQVVSTTNQPIVGATVSLDGQSVLTDAAGRFLLSGIQAGTARPLSVDGHSAFSPNATFPLIFEPASVIAGRANLISRPFILPPIDTSQEVTIDPTRDTVAGNAAVTGLQMTIPPGAHLRMLDGTLVTRASITPLAPDRTPAPLPGNVGTNIVYTSQPGGAITDIPIPVVYPNLAGLNPGTEVDLYAFDHAHVNWFIYGKGRVSTDGRTIAPEINPATGKPYGLPDFSWHFPNTGPNGNGSDPNGCPSSQGQHPVDYATGLKIERVPQVSWGGARGGLAFNLVYTTDKAAVCFGSACPFGNGWTHNWDIRLNGSFTPGGAGRVILPEELTGRLYSSSGTDASGATRFASSSTISGLGGRITITPSGPPQFRDSDGSVYTFNSAGRLISKVDRNGNKTTLTYSGGNLTEITDPAGRSLSFTYDNIGRVTGMTDPSGRRWTYTYGGVSGVQLTSITDPAGNVTQYAYNGARLTSVTAPSGNVIKQLTYDSAGRVSTQTFADGGTERYSYSLSGNIVTSTTVTSTVGRTETRRFNASGYVVSVTDNQGQTSTITRDLNTNLPVASVGSCGCAAATRTFDSSGNVRSATDATGATISINREAAFNNPAQITDPLGHATTFTYDQRGNMLSATNALNQTATFGYDQFGELTSIKDPLGNVRRIEYDAFGNASAVVDALGNRATFEHDVLGRTMTSSDPLGRKTGFTYDVAGHISSYTDAAGSTTSFAYDANGNLTSTTNALGTKVSNSYDAKNRLIAATDALGRTTKLVYTMDNELASITAPSGRTLSFATDAGGMLSTISNASSGSITFAHDSSGRMTSLADERGNAINVSYDAVGRPVSRRDASGNILTAAYNLAGNLSQITDRLGRTTSISRDQLNRASVISYPDAQVSYAYDAAGRLTRIDDTESGFIEFGYDSNGQIISETTANGSIQYAYDASGRVVTTTPGNRPSINYSYDSAGRLAAITQGADVFTYAYDALSRRTSLHRPNGITTQYTYDALGHLTRLTHSNSGGRIIEDIGYTFDSDDRINSISSLAAASLLPASSTANSADASNRISQFGALSFGFDNLGQTVTRADASGVAQFQWDSRGRIIQATLPGGKTVTYGYDPLGRLASRTVNGSTTRFLYSGGDVILDIASDGALVDYLNGPGIDDKLRQTSGSTGPLYFLQDHLGSTIGLSDSTGSVTERERYEVFGFGSGSAFTRYGYTGRELDADTGLLYYRARWYDPQQARFLAEDPAGLAGGSANGYIYTNGDPLNARDPSGQVINLLTAAIGAAAGAGAGALTTTVGTLILQGRLPTGRELAKGTLAGAVTGGVIGLLGPMAAPLVAPLAANLGGGIIGAIGAGATVGGITGAIGGASGQVAANLIDPCNPGSIGQAALIGGLTGGIFGGAASGVKAALSSGAATNPVPSTLARIVEARFANSPTLGAPGTADVFVTTASDVADIDTSQGLATRLALLDNAGNLRQGPFAVIEFDTPTSGLASPVFRDTPGFIQGGLTGGGAREFVLPNLQINQLQNVNVRIIP